MKQARSLFLVALIFTVLFPIPVSADVVRADNDSIAYMGRIHWDGNGHGSFSYPGTTALLRFKGTGLTMVTSPKSGRFFAVTDGGDPVEVTFRDDSVALVAQGLEDRDHEVRIIYSIEGFEFNPQFREFHIDGRLLPYGDKPRLKMEFIGDSITCGFGTEEDDPDAPFSYETENHLLTYAWRAARALDADVNVVARSGIGIYRNYGSPREGDIHTMPLEYDNTMLYNPDIKWDPRSFIPDIICVNLGTNDTSEDNYDIALFESHYRGFLARLRALYPEADIVLLTGAMMQGHQLDDVKTVLDRLAADDSHVHRFDMSPQTGDLGYGAGWHPSERQARKMADELIPFLRTLAKAK